MAEHSAVYVGEGRLLVTTAWGFHLYCPSREMSIVPQLVASGKFERELADFLISSILPGDVVVDIGANIGVFTTMLGHLVGDKGRVFAFEPVSANFDFLRDNVESNWLGPRVSLHQCAIGDSNELEYIKSHPCWGGLASVGSVGTSQMTTGVSGRGSYIEQTQVFRLDDILEGDGELALVKIDVEGHELRVFRGMSQLLADRRIRAVVFECIASRMGDDWRPFVSLLAELAKDGWTFSILRGERQGESVSVEDVAAHGHLYHVLMRRPGEAEHSALQPSLDPLVVGPDDPLLLKIEGAD
ncbi:FkbM family methyltransferase [Mobilicoccus massiliensis]|uniref:FkbM family methyltransferase n=1 Tax=Mobilicoccus massiliensis TaxID=1522310 RepID=UPI0006940188|nr:FkbM family methyltransferase [Mobilicoccus massiliensis]